MIAFLVIGVCFVVPALAIFLIVWDIRHWKRVRPRGFDVLPDDRS